ncbi:Uncharacterised protein (plasmid) [Tsukamurella tyrosinosolvens]|uniref:Uncharacterized protein n=1 Tax=Tsukamurella tyrosinosolvens TaxID=57704 RepID=A0A1H4VSW9_TSUTY|nr:hypothetical protein [Tsukamurella tyrosinosolvens]KXO90910.1 hypothetical protein AXK58_20980 [Tsukamurella tyrosinosolvens]SEC83364.1 hypothetical protein SAMN04489793_3306 [Tsukamurella tyrosinosolvens]VEH90360.1 Uncharacterised protein [Tsukamurella tyrosinosolvens]
MLTPDLDKLAKLLAPVPAGTPAAWWITTDPIHLDEAQVFEAAHAQWVRDITVLAEEAGSSFEEVYTQSSLGVTRVAGFAPAGDGAPAPGWRLSVKLGLLVPSRRTAADRATGSSERFAALEREPRLGSYVTGIDSGMRAAGNYYGTQFYLRDGAIMAFLATAPEAADTIRSFHVAESWQRTALSVFHRLHEAGGETVAA